LGEIAKWLLEWAKDSPFLVFIITALFVAIIMGTGYIKAISEARSRQRHDDVQLLEKENRLRERINNRLRKKK
jgi:hypothetical protein